MVIFIRDPMRILTAEQRERLRASHIDSADQLANRVLADHSFLNQLDAETRRSAVKITAQVTASRAGSVVQPFYRSHALDFLLVAVALLAGIAVWRDFHVPSVPDVPDVLVQRSGGLPPFHVIVPADIALAKPSASHASIIGDFSGRYSRVYVAFGEPISKEKLSNRLQLSTELDDRIIVRLKTQSTNPFSGMVPPYRAALIAAPHERGTSALFLSDVFVLDLQTDGDGLAGIFALPSSDELLLAAFMARSDFFLVAHQP